MTGGPTWWAGLDLGRAPADGPAAFDAALDPDTLLAAYRAGAFPLPAPDEYAMWMNEGRHEEQVATGAIAAPEAGAADGTAYGVAWWCPDPRPVVPVDGVRLGRRLARRLRNGCPWTTTADKAFTEVVEGCAEGRSPVWLTPELRTSLAALHARGRAHSVEVWEDGTLVGGVFGIRVGPVLSLDSMVSLRPDAARVAVADLAARFAETGGRLLDAQWDGPHVRSLGALPMPRSEYLALLRAGAGDEAGAGAGPPVTGPLPGEERTVAGLGR